MEESLPGLSYQDLDKGHASKESLPKKEGDHDNGEPLSNNLDPEKGPRRVKSTRNEAFDRREMEEMEVLLKETRGHLGEKLYYTTGKTGPDLLKWSIRHISWKGKTWRIIFFSLQTGMWQSSD